MLTEVEKSFGEQEEGNNNLVKTSMQAVSEIVDNIVQQKQAGNIDVNALASREIDKYYEKESDNAESQSLIPKMQDLLDGIHGEGVVPEEGEKAPYEDDNYGEQPPMSLPSSPTPPEKPSLAANAAEDQLITSRRRKEKEVKSKKEESGPPPNPFKQEMERYDPEKAQVQNKNSIGTNASDNAFSFTNLPKPGETRAPYHDDPDYDNVAMELGMTPQTHPEFFRKRGYKLPLRILYNKYCQYCMIICGFVLLSLSVAALVTRGFDEVKKHNAQLHSKEDTHVSSSKGNKEKEKLDWWLDMGGMNEQQFEALTYALEDSYLPIWFDRKSGWEGQTYEEAVEFCADHDDFMPCPYDGELKYNLLGLQIFDA